MKVYISGSITNGGSITDAVEIEANRERFRLVEKQLRGLGHEPVNPAALDLDPALREGRELWQFYMRACLALLLECDAIFMMRGWSASDGAQFELYMAQKLGMRVMGMAK